MLVGAGRPPPPFRTVAITGSEVIVIGQTPPHWRAALGPVTSSALLEFADTFPVRIQAVRRAGIHGPIRKAHVPYAGRELLIFAASPGFARVTSGFPEC